MNKNIVEEREKEVERLANLSVKVNESYRDIIVEGALSTYFSLVENGYFDAAQNITPQIRDKVKDFQDKITDVISSYEKTLFSETLEEVLHSLVDFIVGNLSLNLGEKKESREEPEEDDEALEQKTDDKEEPSEEEQI